MLAIESHRGRLAEYITIEDEEYALFARANGDFVSRSIEDEKRPWAWLEIPSDDEL